MACWRGACRLCRIRAADPTEDAVDVIDLNVGGFRFTVSCATLARCPEESSLRKVLTSQRLPDGSFFLDRDGRHFHHILNYLRDGKEHFCAPLDPDTRLELCREAKVYGLGELASLVSAAEEHVGAPMPANEVERIVRLDDLDIMHTHDHETHYDSITRIVAALLQVPIVLISLVHSDHQWFKSRCGLDAKQTPRGTSFCAFSFIPVDPTAHSMFVIEDAHADARVSTNPLVTGPPHIAFYAGSPLVTSDGVRLGALCAIDRIARKLSHKQAQALISFSTIVSQEIERKQLREQNNVNSIDEDADEVANAGLDFAAGGLRTFRMKDALTEVVVLMVILKDDVRCPLLYGNQLWSRATGALIWPPTCFPGQADVSGRGVPWNTQDSPGREPCLWDWFEIEGKRREEVHADILRACEAPEPHCVGLLGFLTMVSEGTNVKKRMPVSCCISPIQLPLDANAAAILPVPSLSSAIGDNLNGLVGGYLCFAQMMSGSDEWQQVAESIDVSMARDTPVKRELSKKENSNESRPSKTQSDDLNLSDNVRRLGTGLKAVENLKPPRSPFEDVRLVRLVGQGSFGKVYYGLWMGSPVAVKVICVHDVDKQKNLEPIFEGALSSLVAHPNLVQTFQYSSRQKSSGDNGEDVYETWIVQEWCDRGTLSKHCSRPRNDQQCLAEVLDICKEIAGAGAYLHHRGIIHGDLTANNVLIKSDISPKGYTCKICDFGLARILEGEECEIVTTQLGTVTHMPPELFQLEKSSIKLSTKADVWATGILLWQALMGKSPFAGMSPPQVVVLVASGRRLELPEDSPKCIRDIFYKCCATDPDLRPDFHDLITMLTEAIEQLDAEVKAGQALRPKPSTQ